LCVPTAAIRVRVAKSGIPIPQSTVKGKNKHI
jgi:hypothetical protein